MSRFLVLEDEPLIAEMLALWLEGEGHRVVAHAQTNAAALSLIETVSPEAAILDVKVSDGYAYAVADRLKERRIPFAFATGWSRDHLEPAYQAEMIIGKPFDFEKLNAHVAELLRRRVGHDTLAFHGHSTLCANEHDCN